MLSDPSRVDELAQEQKQFCYCIVLVGFMGAGKSTVAGLLAERLGWRSVDLDDEIAKLEGKAVHQIFSDHGQDHFRALESSLLAKCLSSGTKASPLTLALGGGAIESAANRRRIAEAAAARTFYLEAPLAALLERCAGQQEADGLPVRPLLADSEILFERRAGLYASVGAAVSTFGFSAEQVAVHILSLLQMENALDPAHLERTRIG